MSDQILENYEGAIVEGRPHGHGKIRNENGSIYVGDFSLGEYHGEGTLYFPGQGKIDGFWEHGSLSSFKFYFEDGLPFELQDWGYITEKNRLFQAELVNGIGTPVTKEHPDGTYFVGDGYYDPSNGKVFDCETGAELRRVTGTKEVEWIKAKCSYNYKPGDVPGN
ncbi:MORN repeat [Carpediemonas membranifera]|uniref:MORN repeat-containing protein 5 n=1 Tax=Carpediemonas membranifera TaxID=201153 RepID=A0A8J6BVX2_9EUKA|nr:MORN repeat [Carpediemonas membranifera]|eukprot:KAG9391851.1 MORN repeat [Carpediemonas membranifera]